MGDAGSQIQEVVDRETRAWDTQDAELLLSVFHPDMVWPWPKTPSSHDPMDWALEWGRYDRERWLGGGQERFDTHELARNGRGAQEAGGADRGPLRPRAVARRVARALRHARAGAQRQGDQEGRGFRTGGRGVGGGGH